jgi:hypothetical protein
VISGDLTSYGTISLNVSVTPAGVQDGSDLPFFRCNVTDTVFPPQGNVLISYYTNSGSAAAGQLVFGACGAATGNSPSPFTNRPFMFYLNNALGAGAVEAVGVGFGGGYGLAAVWQGDGASGTVDVSWAGMMASQDLGNCGMMSYPKNDGTTFYLFNNAYYDGTNIKAKVTGASSMIVLNTNGSFNVYAAPSVSGGSNRTYINTMVADVTGAIFWPNIGTTASAANCFLNAASTPTNNMLRSTSSRRYKTNIQDLVDDGALLKLRPVTYTSTSQHDDPATVHLGLIAEEVAEIDPRLVHFADGKPESVQYERLTVLLLAHIQRLEQRLAAAGVSLTQGEKQ